MRTRPCTRLLAASLVLVASAADARVLRVPSSFATIQKAIYAAADGDEVLVSPGTYTENISIAGKSLQLIGEGGPELTIVDGGKTARVLFITTSSGHPARVSGFTFQNGFVKENSVGAGIYAANDGVESLIIENNIIVDNANRNSFGGGLYADGSGFVIRHNRIARNSANAGGGGMDINGGYGNAVIGNLVEQNGTGLGGVGGILIAGASVTVEGNVVTGNEDGGIYAEVDSPYIANNLVYGNTMNIFSAVWVSEYSSGSQKPFMVTNNTIVDNNVTGEAGGAAAAQFHIGYVRNHGKIYNNIIATSGGGVAIDCAGREERLAFGSNDVYTTGEQAASGTCAAIAVEGSNLSVLPGFAGDSGKFPYQLAPDSPLVDAGSNDAARPIHVDLLRHARVIDGGHGAIVDIGAYEYWPR